jgi:hypothetical protein
MYYNLIEKVVGTAKLKVTQVPESECCFLTLTGFRPHSDNPVSQDLVTSVRTRMRVCSLDENRVIVQVDEPVDATASVDS